MRKLVLAFAIGAGAVWSYAPPARALCDFDAPAKARQLKLDMVRAFPECPPPADTGGFCVPVVPLSPYEFDVSGKCTAKLKIGVEESCGKLGNYLDEPCQTLAMHGNCSGILRPGGAELIDGSVDAGWTVRLIGRYTVDREMFFGLAPAEGDRTYIDFLLEGIFSVPNNGSMKTSTLLPRDQSQLFGPPYRQYASPCSTVEIVRVEILDPDENVFSVPGMSTR